MFLCIKHEWIQVLVPANDTTQKRTMCACLDVGLLYVYLLMDRALVGFSLKVSQSKLRFIDCEHNCALRIVSLC